MDSEDLQITSDLRNAKDVNKQIHALLLLIQRATVGKDVNYYLPQLIAVHNSYNTIQTI